MKTRFFCVAVEGATTDGRVIERSWIEDMAAGYKPSTYTARINVEHLRGFSPEPPFNAYGTVAELEARDIEIELAGKKEKRRALFASLEPNEQLLTVNKNGQKLFTSCEVNPNFAGTGKAYLVGLAVTDTPASLGTEMLQFAAGQGDKNPLASRKRDPANLFTAAGDHTLDLTPAEAPAPAATETPSLLSQVLSVLAGKSPVALTETPATAPAAPVAAEPVAAPVAAPAAAPATPPAAANDNLSAVLALLASETDRRLGSIETAFATLTQTLSKEPDNNATTRPFSTGTASGARTDC